MKRFGFKFNIGVIIDAENIDEAKAVFIKSIREADDKDLIDTLELRYIQNEDGEYEYECDDFKEVQ